MRTSPAPRSVDRRPVSGSEEGWGTEFAAGTVLADRYRIVGVLGKGGMGEVYRADDLTLGQGVALKFLPAGFQDRAGRLERFYNEVRVARQISHPNVCRVYDIGEWEGRTFFTMEFVDGEDLSSLLRRIGRLPQEKGLEIARQLCAGLAALHDRGVLHRDLKPANIMLDGRGRVRITDFGLSTELQDLSGDEVMAGTPAYMAPEQLAGKDVTAKSDLYALGLVFYELFTGKKAFEADSVAELRRKHRDETPVLPSEIVPTLDQATERVISRCLDKEPSRRPASAMAVAAALPGGDPLAAALAAGETPSPEMVAGANVGGSMPALAAMACVAAVVIALVLNSTYLAKHRIDAYVPLEKPPAVLVERAQSILASVEYSKHSRDNAFGFLYDDEFIDAIADRDSTSSKWEALRDEDASAIYFWYRQSPEQMIPYSSSGTLTAYDPPSDVPGMASVLLDPSGRLLGFSVVPPETVSVDSAAAAVDWSRYFAEAKLDTSRFTSVKPLWRPESYADTRRAWEAIDGPADSTRLRVEVASAAGHPVSFTLVNPWRRPTALGEEAAAPTDATGNTILFMTFIFVILLSSVMAHRNVQRGRGDRKGTLHLMFFFFFLTLASWFLTVNYVSDVLEMGKLFFDSVGGALFVAFLVGAFYLAIEPYVRRLWPERMVSWTRLLLGGWRDPLVARDVLYGGAAFLVMALGEVIFRVITEQTGSDLGAPRKLSLGLLLGQGAMVDAFANQAINGVVNGLFFVMLLFFYRKLFRRQWLGVIAFILTFLLVGLAGPKLDWLGAGAAALMGGFIAFIVLRLGVLTIIFTWFLQSAATSYPFSFDSSRWTSGIAAFATGAILFIVVVAAANVMKGKSFLEEDAAPK